MEKKLKTKFASSERSTQEQIQQSQNSVAQESFFVETLNAIPNVVLVLNKNRQMVYSNDQLLKILSLSSIDGILGKRPGEVFNCVHSTEEEGGCGTTEFCKECGAVNAILTAQGGKEDSRECRLTARSDDGDIALDLRVWAVPLTVQGEKFTVFTIVDISDEKRREVLERTFFHDIMNDVLILKGYTENAKDGLVKLDDAFADSMERFSKRLINTIQEQRDLINAEKGVFAPSTEEFPVRDLYDEIVSTYQKSKIIKERTIKLECDQDSGTIVCDKVILTRILVNLIKNAIEATEDDAVIVAGYRLDGEKKVFYVNNPGCIPRNVQLQIFQRSFSTKGPGRGIGTYSIKLFATKYLNGKVSFETSEDLGTTFYLEL